MLLHWVVWFGFGFFILIKAFEIDQGCCRSYQERIDRERHTFQDGKRSESTRENGSFVFSPHFVNQQHQAVAESVQGTHEGLTMASVLTQVKNQRQCVL